MDVTRGVRRGVWRGVRRRGTCTLSTTSCTLLQGVWPPARRARFAPAGRGPPKERPCGRRFWKNARCEDCSQAGPRGVPRVGDPDRETNFTSRVPGTHPVKEKTRGTRQETSCCHSLWGWWRVEKYRKGRGRVRPRPGGAEAQAEAMARGTPSAGRPAPGRRRRAPRQGSCPPPRRARGFSARCSRSHGADTAGRATRRRTRARWRTTSPRRRHSGPGLRGDERLSRRAEVHSRSIVREHAPLISPIVVEATAITPGHEAG